MNKKNNKKRVRIELYVSPILIIIPFIIGCSFIINWYIFGWLQNNTSYDYELLIGLIIIIGNMAADIPFTRKILTKQ